MHIILVMAVTADGKIGKNSNHFPDWTSVEDKEFFAKISKKHKIVIMGDKTFFTLPAPLPDRLNVVFTQEKNPQPIKGVKWVAGDPKKVLAELEGLGFKSAILGGGAYLNSLFLEQKLIDEIIITIEPKIFGQGLSIFSKDFDINLKLKEIQKLNPNSFFVRYQVLY